MAKVEHDADPFLTLAHQALGDSNIAVRLTLGRKAAEALCKTVAGNSFPEKVGDLSRMIGWLFSKKLIPCSVSAHLEVVRVYGNLGSHDNSQDPKALDLAKGALTALKDWYENVYNPYPPHLSEIKASEQRMNEVYLGGEVERPEYFGPDGLDIVAYGSKPFSYYEFTGFLAEFDENVSLNPSIHSARCGAGSNLWIISGREDWEVWNLPTILNPPNEEILIGSEKHRMPWRISLSEKDGFSLAKDDSVNARLDGLGVVFMGQEAMLDYLYQKNFTVTQDDVFAHPLHSAHPAVEALMVRNIEYLEVEVQELQKKIEANEKAEKK